MLLLVAGVAFLYPACQYYIDPDGTAYLTISQRYANGDFNKAINGYWSPWSCWLTALGIKAGMEAIPASILVNTLAGVGVLGVTQSFFIKMQVQRRLQWWLNTSLAVFLCYAVYIQTFADLWEVFLLLGSLRIMLADGYVRRPALWVLNGMVGALAYFAKAYAFPFFILNTLCCSYYLCRAGEQKLSYAHWLKMSIAPIAVMIACGSPWIYAMHDKYGIWTTSTAGKLNTSWYLVGHPYWNDNIRVLLPPVYPDSPYYWEDPYVVNGDTPQFWSSFKLFALQIARVGLNLWKLAKSMLQLSPAFVVVWLLAIAAFFRAAYRQVYKGKERMVVLSFLLFPLGFLLINYEPRYIWYMLPLSMVLGASALQRRNAQPAVIALFALSYMLWPLWDVHSIWGKGRAEYQLAQQMRSMGIQGSFTTALPHGPHTQKLARLAYFSGNSYYMIPGITITQAALMADMRRYGVKYYLQYTAAGDTTQPLTADGKAYPEVTKGRLPGIKIFRLLP